MGIGLPVKKLPSRTWSGILLTAVWVVFANAAWLAAHDLDQGRAIYLQHCAACHGDKGQGDETIAPLIGDKPLRELVELIDRTMPEGSPDDCRGEDATSVAAYIYDAFYSPDAQLRNAPPRLELSRLTVRQYEQSLTDLIAQGRGNGQLDDQRGLNAELFKNRRFRGNERAEERIDAQVDFDFGAEGPAPGKVTPEEYAIRWRGGLIAPETGTYEMIVRVSGGARMWLNDNSTAFLDGWVQSGEVSEHRGEIKLLGGRVVPLRLEFFKAKNFETAGISLRWRRPHGVEEPIPSRYLSPNNFGEIFILNTAFPPDDRSTGFERATTISHAWERATTAAALEVAGYVAARLPRLAGVSADVGRDDAKLRGFCLSFAERAFRRPLTQDEQALFVDRQLASAENVELAVKRVVLLVLKSPRFLYRKARVDEFDQYALAGWLSFGLWDSLPDDELLRAAREGRLDSREEIQRQAERMLKDRRARAKLARFFEHWVGTSHFQDLGKDTEAFPGFDEQLLADLRTSLELYLERLVWDDRPDFRRLLQENSIPLNGRLAAFYGVDLPEDADFQWVEFEADQRAGLLTHPYLMAGFAYHDETSPIHRGVFLARSVLGRFLRPPPDAFTPLAAELHPDLTNRQRVELQTEPENCRGCHSLINPLGFALERFDAVGRLRTEELGKPVDATGVYRTRDDQEVRFEGARALAEYLAGSPETHQAFAEHLFVYFIKQPPHAFGAEARGRIDEAFRTSEFDIHKLAAAVVAESAWAAREVVAQRAEDTTVAETSE